ncbi:Gmad2 immunoglobulin-like domain-containing protein [Nocardioides sp. LML1-1-1.1]|uniref:Gmad2 immunoglobulin-like domain-containing protein n=1 Tax=Nocardioides sp. LML1-1-1.1 TaxID=3135248 RepID=UPI00341203F6
MQTPLRRTARVVALAALGAGLLAGCGDDDEPAAGDSSPSASPSTSASASGPATPTTPGRPAVIPVYYVGDTPQGDRLFREFTQASGVDPLVAAAAAVTSGDPVDPDYRTLWPTGRFASVVRTSEAIVVELPDRTWLTRGSLDAERARLAVQQLVHTLQGVAAKRLPVRVTLDGKPAPTLLGVDASDGLTAGPELDTLALVNVTEPAEGSVVGDEITATGRASSFEATVPWTIADSTGKVVQQGFATAEGWMDKLYPWTTTIDVSSLAPGRYTLTAATDDPSDGEGGGPTEDTKRITVE